MSRSRIEPDIPDSCFFGKVSPLVSSSSICRSFSYERLPPQLLRLSVLKLDGSCFEVEVARTATVAELRDAVERVFCQFPKNKITISWPHVWGHFCLCYKTYKLIDDKAYIRHFGIRDDDQLNFANNLSICKDLQTRRTRGQLFSLNTFCYEVVGSQDE